MLTITDADLLLFHYRDGLDPDRLAEIAAALASDAELSRRYALLQAVLAASALDLVPEPSAGFNARLQAHCAQLAGSADRAAYAMPAPTTSARAGSRRRLLRRVSAAAAALLLLVIGFQAGQHSVQPVDSVATQPKLDAARIYRTTLAGHLGNTRQALLSAVNASQGEFRQDNADLAQALIENNRLYLAAAEAGGDHRLAELLRVLEPVLIELANPTGSSDIQFRKGVATYLERSDLLFQVRAAEAGLRARTVTRT